MTSYTATQQRLQIRDMMTTLRAFITLTKPGIQIMLIFTAYCAMVVADKRLPSIKLTIFTLVGLVCATGGSAVINMWFDRDIDAVMSRTKARPLPMGLLSPRTALIFGLVLVAFSFTLLAISVNLLSALFALAGVFYYAVIYTMWLKRTTVHNTVIGGGAGAFPPLIGWAAVTGHMELAPLLMFAIIFFWQPPHFWALALYKNMDYVKAKIPMMPAVRGARYTKIQSLIYATLLIMSTVALYLTGTVGIVYFVVSTIFGLVFLGYNIRLFFEPDNQSTWAKKTFLSSLMYLPVVFLAMCIPF
ncbi:protoheme IX farnesyltransferase [Alicyclobacillus curvatus]|jgi:heme o synthase|nr:protoheme IX farnesyltransferase [Alicyclobacillus curvatus]